MPYVAQATKEEIKANKRRCWWTGCKNRAWLEDWSGWHWCYKHWYWSARDHVEGRGLKAWGWQIKKTKIK